MGGTVSRTDFDWVYTEEPHATRRKQILEKYPEMKKLMGTDSNMKYKATLLVLVNFLLTYLVRDLSWPVVIIISYIIGGVINHALTLAIHEIAHNLAFGHTHPMSNRLFGIFANLPIGLPMSISFRKYHLEHHKYQGDDEIDVDIPSKVEAVLFTNTLTKLVWVILQPFFYALRPLFVRPKTLTGLEAINVAVQVLFNYFIFQTCGIKSLSYMIVGSLLAMGLHPVAGHFISEHYVFVKGYETYSYYGCLNWVTFNVGYHNEHHDFPNIPGCRLPEVRKIAPEFYDNLPCHTSWSKVIWDFITDPDVGPYARIKRKSTSKTSASKNGKISNGSETNGKVTNGNGLLPSNGSRNNGYPNGDGHVIKSH